MEKANPPDETALIKRWVETWKFAGPELERSKREELRALSDDEILRRIFRVMGSRVKGAWPRPKQPLSSGLIEQQRLFAKLASSLK